MFQKKHIKHSFAYTHTHMQTKNITLVTSVICPPNRPLSYSYVRSVYTREERFEQTKCTLATIKTQIPDNLIVLVECSPLSPEENAYFTENTDLLINIYDLKDKEPDLIDNIYGRSKSMGEGTMTLCALMQIFANNIIYDNLFKVSGRYWLNENFDYANFDNDQIVVSYLDEEHLTTNAFTALYKLPIKYVREWYNHLLGSGKDFNDCVGYEVIFAKFLQRIKHQYVKNECIKNIPKIGLSGYVTVCGTLCER